MKEIGKKLLNQRKKMGLSYEDVSEITKLPLPYLKAIEKGDLEYFKNDLTYVRFYVRSYCKAVGLPYENMKDDVLESINEYTHTLTVKELQAQEEVEANIVEKSENIRDSKGPQLTKKDRVSIRTNVQQSTRFRKARRVDFAYLSLIIVASLIVVLLVYVGVTALLDKEDTPAPKQDPISVKTPTPEVEKPKKETDKEDKKEKEEVKPKLTFTKEKPGEYVVGGIKADETIRFEVSFPTASQFNLWRGNVAVEGAYRYFNANEPYIVEEKATKMKTIYTFNFWNYQKNVIKINGEELKLDEIPAPQNGVTYIVVKVIGE